MFLAAITLQGLVEVLRKFWTILLRMLVWLVNLRQNGMNVWPIAIKEN